MARHAPVLLGSFFALATLMCAVTAATFFAPQGALSAIWRIKPAEYAQLLALGRLVAWGFLGLAVVMALAAWGSFHRRRWGWTLAFALIAANALGDLARLASGAWVEGLTGVALAGLVLLWLARPPVRAQFA